MSSSLPCNTVSWHYWAQARISEIFYWQQQIAKILLAYMFGTNRVPQILAHTQIVASENHISWRPYFMSHQDSSLRILSQVEIALIWEVFTSRAGLEANSRAILKWPDRSVVSQMVDWLIFAVMKYTFAQYSWTKRWQIIVERMKRHFTLLFIILIFYYFYILLRRHLD